jgi:hypothetical protein
LDQLRGVIRQEVKGAVAPLATREEMHAGFAQVNAVLHKLTEDVATLVSDIGDYIDKRLRPLEKRVDRLDEHVGLPKPQ